MSDRNLEDTLDTHASQTRFGRFKAAWLAWHAGASVPRWQDHLPADDEAADSELIFYLLQLDIECRIKAGVPALLAEAYFAHPRLQRDDARLDAERQVELIRWEYQQRWQKHDAARRADYQAAFPQHAHALHDLKPSSRCPRCRQIFVVDETVETLLCPHCGSDAQALAESFPWQRLEAELQRVGPGSDADELGAAPSFVAPITALAVPHELDLRRYELSETLGKGGMGEVYRCVDPALGRDLAIKVMRRDLRGYSDIERRFLREARITASLQHPSIVPIHNLGRLADGRMHYTMRLVRGDTFADILKQEAGKSERLPYLLSIFEKICQAVAYAHSKRVIHRDLKPHNVMVGKFGEVQVMDWGLAKLLTMSADSASPGEQSEDGGTRIHTESGDTPSNVTRPGSGMGTPAYMPPEQALGKWDTVDERADVFALGAILCQILTGKPAYSSTDWYEEERRAKHGDLAETWERLEQCGADPALLALCRECLTPQREGRPRDAAIVAERVASYQAEVQERLRQVELERVAAETRAQEEKARVAIEEERTREALARAVAESERAQEALARIKAERRAKRRSFALAAAVLLLVAGIGGGLWWRQLQQDQTDHDALAALDGAEMRRDAGWQQQVLSLLGEARAEAERAADIAHSGGASKAVVRKVAAFQTQAQKSLDRAKENQQLLGALVDIATPHETMTYQADVSGGMMALAEPSVEEQYAAVFRRRWPDVDIDKQSVAEVAARVQEEPEIVVQGVIAGLDGWMLERRQQQRSDAEWRRLLDVAERLDPSDARRQLRALLIGALPPSAASVTGLLAGWPPWPAVWELGRGQDWRLLRQLRGQMNQDDEAVLTLLLLAQASSAIGDAAGAEEVLRRALARRPDEVVLLNSLGNVMKRQGRLTEAVGCFRAARARHRELGIAFASALVESRQAEEGEAVLRDLIRQQPKNPEIVFYVGNALNSQGKFAEAETAYQQAIALKPDYERAYNNLGIVLNSQRKPREAEAAFRQTLALKPDLSEAYVNLGTALYHQEKHTQAEAVCRQAIALKPDVAEAYVVLGNALNGQGRTREAELAYLEAIALRPDYGDAYSNLGHDLSDQGKPVEAEAACRRAIALQPNLAEAYNNLGNALYGQGKPVEAKTAYLRAIALKPDLAQAYSNLGNTLNDEGKPVEAEAACRKAITLKPNHAAAYNNLGSALSDQGKHGAAEAAYRQAIALKPDDAEAYNNLGVVLLILSKAVESEEACRQALALKSNFAFAHFNLANALKRQEKYPAAEEAYRKAIKLKPNYTGAYLNLGNTLNAAGKPAAAEEAYRKAIILDLKYPLAHAALGELLLQQGRFSEAIRSTRRALELLSQDTPLRRQILQQLQQGERMLALEKKLSAVLAGEAMPANAGEALTLAGMCQQPYMKRYAASARLFADAFTAESKLADDLNQQLRYSAACCAALAAAVQGQEARLLPDKVANMFRCWALGWLRDDLKAYAKLADRNNPALNKVIQQRLMHWFSDSDLISVREAPELERLPDKERAAWQLLWREVDELAKRVATQQKRKP